MKISNEALTRNRFISKEMCTQKTYLYFKKINATVTERILAKEFYKMVLKKKNFCKK